jgi:hypothetical protein
VFVLNSAAAIARKDAGQFGDESTSRNNLYGIRRGKQLERAKTAAPPGQITTEGWKE